MILGRVRVDRRLALFEFLQAGNNTRITIEPGRSSLAYEVLNVIRKDIPEARLPSNEAQPVKPDPVTMWNDTADKLERLKMLRRDYMTSHNGEVLAWTSACRLVGIDPKTANKHAKELRKNWDNREYREL